MQSANFGMDFITLDDSTATEFKQTKDFININLKKY